MEINNKWTKYLICCGDWKIFLAKCHVILRLISSDFVVVVGWLCQWLNLAGSVT